MRKPRPPQFLRDSDGAITIEFVMTLPIFLIALAFSFEFGQYFLAHQNTVNNVRAASRYLARIDDPEEHLAEAANIIRTGRTQGGQAPDYLENACTSPATCIFEPAGGPSNARTVRAQVALPVQLLGIIGISADMKFTVREDLRLVGE